MKRLGKYSYSSLNTFESCRKKFQFTYIDKIKREKKGNAPAIMGFIAHRVLEKLYKLGFENVLYPKDEMVKYYQDEWNKIVIDYIEVTSDFQTVDDYIKIGEQILCDYYDKFQPFNQDTLLGSELNLFFTLPETDFQFNCRIDRLSKRADGVIEIVDYQTGTFLAKATDKSFHFQMGLYLLAVRANYPDFKEIELVQYYLRHGETVRYRMREDEEDNLIEEFKQMIIETMNATSLKSFPPTESSFCKFCDYADICPAKIHNLMIEGEAESSTGELSAEMLKDLANKFIEKNKESKAVKEELDSLKAQLIEISKQHEISIFESDLGKVNVSIKNDLKFVTKTDDPKAFSELNYLCRESGLDDFFVLDSRALMKDGVKKQRLAPELQEKLQQFIEEVEVPRVTVKKKSEKDTDDRKIIR